MTISKINGKQSKYTKAGLSKECEEGTIYNSKQKRRKTNQWENKTNSRPAENIKDQSKTRQDLVNKPDRQCDKKNRKVGFSRPAENIEDQSKTRQDLL